MLCCLSENRENCGTVLLLCFFALSTCIFKRGKRTPKCTSLDHVAGSLSKATCMPDFLVSLLGNYPAGLGSAHSSNEKETAPRKNNFYVKRETWKNWEKNFHFFLKRATFFLFSSFPFLNSFIPSSFFRPSSTIKRESWRVWEWKKIPNVFSTCALGGHHHHRAIIFQVRVYDQFGYPKLPRVCRAHKREKSP